MSQLGSAAWSPAGFQFDSAFSPELATAHARLKSKEIETTQVKSTQALPSTLALLRACSPQLEKLYKDGKPPMISSFAKLSVQILTR
jgi:hypothetical protein